MLFVMNPPQTNPEACHNCRRRRLKCDRVLPQCLKCIKRGQECLGYQNLFRWERGVASRGKMAGRTFGELTKHRASHDNSSPHLSSPVSHSSLLFSRGNDKVSLLGSLTDPLVRDVNHTSKKYLVYCELLSLSYLILIPTNIRDIVASHVCKDLVLYDTPKHNRFRDLIPLTHQHPVLFQIIIANSALHMSNACQKSLISGATAFPLRHCPNLLGSPCSSSSAVQQPVYYNDALAAKQRALYLLRSALTNLATVDIDVILAVVLLFVEFELIDSGRDNWRYHINGARAIIEALCGSNISLQIVESPLRSFLIANWVVFVGAPAPRPKSKHILNTNLR